jgi:phage shock protein A
MFEIAVRIKELTSSNLNHLVEQASSPAKMLGLLQLELEEAIISLARDAAKARRLADDAAAAAKASDKAAKDWQDKAKLAIANGREDLARGALGERQNAEDLAKTQRRSATDATAEQAALNTAVAGLEGKLEETRSRLRAELGAKAAQKPGGSAASGPSARSSALDDRIATLEKRIDFAQASAGHSASAASIEQELDALQREAMIEAELAALRKSAKKK